MNQLTPFMINNGLAKGVYINADLAISEMIACHTYPDIVNHILAQAALLALALSHTIKYEGIFSFQIKGDGAIKNVYVSATHDKQIRGYCVFEPDNLPATDFSNTSLFGKGNLLFSVSQIGKEPYQGIVQLTGKSLIDSVVAYFAQSEQIKTDIILQEKNNQYRCILLQKMPDKKDISSDEQADLYETASVLLHSVKKSELFDKNLPPEKLLYRLFHANDLVVFKSTEPLFHCPCHSSKMKHFLDNLEENQRNDLFQDNKITLSCQFCNKQYTFTPADFK